MRKVLMICMIFILILQGCTNNKEYLEDMSTPRLEEITDNSYKLSWENIDLSISQNNSVMRNCAFSNAGYYYIEHNKIIKYFDYSTQRSSVWCNKMVCEHNDDSCSAVLSIENNSVNFIFYQSGKIYLLGRDEDGYFMESYNEDGSNYEKLCRLWTTNSNIWFGNGGNDKIIEYSTRCIAIHKGKAYYAVTYDNNVILYEIELKSGAERKELYRFESEGYDYISMDSLQIADNNLVLEIEKTNVSEVTGKVEYEYKYLVYRVNIDTSEVLLLLEDADCLYDLNGDFLYTFIFKEGIYKINVNDGTKEFLFNDLNSEDGISVVRVSDNYIITFTLFSETNNGVKIVKIYNHELEKLDELEYYNIEDVSGFDGRFIYGYRLIDLKNTPDNKGDDMIMEALWSVEDIGKKEKCVVPFQGSY